MLHTSLALALGGMLSIPLLGPVGLALCGLGLLMLVGGLLRSLLTF